MTATSDFYVYVLFRPWDGSPFYVGKGRGRRWLHHERRSTSSNKGVRIIVSRAKLLDLEIPKIKIREGLTEAEAFAIEMAFIAAIGRRANGGPLVNASDGGGGPTGPKSDEHKRKISIALQGHSISASNLEKLRQSIIGKPLSSEHRAKLRDRKLGRKLSEDHKASIRATHIKLSANPEVREKKRQAALTRWSRGISSLDINDINGETVSELQG